MLGVDISLCVPEEANGSCETEGDAKTEGEAKLDGDTKVEGCCGCDPVGCIEILKCPEDAAADVGGVSSKENKSFSGAGAG